MALKDWRISRESTRHLSWAKPFSYERIDIFGIKPSLWRVVITDENVKEFKTRSKAIKFTREYMKTH